MYVLHCIHQLIGDNKRKLNTKGNGCIALFIVMYTFLVDSKSRLHNLHISHLLHQLTVLRQF